jgi:serine-type D-Ala-D-Ala carboxypeptidase/endopeptidase
MASFSTRALRSAACSVLAIVVVGTTAASQSAGLLSDQAIRSIVVNRVDVERQHVGVVAGVIDAAGRRVVGHGTFGKSDARPVDGHTVFEIGSVTKVFTSLLLADMAGRGEVAIDDPVAKYLPASVKVPMRGTTAITLQDLATHTSGLPRLPTNLVVTNMDNPYADYSVENLHAFLSGHVLTRDIGTQFEYSNLGVGLLGHALALRARANYETLVRTRILLPLKMQETSIQLDKDMAGRLAAGHNARLEPAGNWDIPTLAGAGALRSTVSDLLQFLSAFVGTTKSELSPATTRMLSVRRPAMAGLMSALGWQVVTRDGMEIVWHSGATGGYSAFVAYVPSRAVGVVVLANNTGAAGSSVDDLGMHLLDPRVPLAKPIPHRTRITVDPAVLARYAGTYEIAPGFLVAVTHEEGRLFVTPPGQPRHEIFAESERVFFTTIANVQFSFDVDATGPAKAMTLHQAGKSTTGERVDVAALPPAPPRQVVTVKPEVLETWVGRYQMTPAVFITVTRQEGRLFGQATGQGAFELFPESEDRFFAKVGGIEIWFDRDAQGRSTALNIRQGGITRQLKRVE